jgi:hypothetical protein
LFGIAEPPLDALALSGQSVSIFHRTGTFIENPDASTALVNNIEECDYSGFKQLPGSLKLTWRRHAVRSKSWESRHAQEMLRSIPQRRQKGPQRAEPDDTFITTDIDPEDL